MHLLTLRATNGLCENKSAFKYLNLHSFYPSDTTKQNKHNPINCVPGMKSRNTLLSFTIFIKNTSLFKKTQIIPISLHPFHFYFLWICLFKTNIRLKIKRHLYFKLYFPSSECHSWQDTLKTCLWPCVFWTSSSSNSLFLCPSITQPQLQQISTLLSLW